MTSIDEQQIKDQLGQNPDTFPLLNANYSETVFIEEGPTRVSKSSFGDTWVVGTSTNAIVGPFTGTPGGTQLLVGNIPFILGNPTFAILGQIPLGDAAGGSGSEILRVVNPFNRFIERFRDLGYIDASNTSASVDTVTNFRVDFTAGEILQSTIIFKNEVDVNNARIQISGTGSFELELSSDGGTTFEIVDNNESVTFGNIGGTPSVFPLTFPFTLGGTAGGQELIYRITENNSSTGSITFVQVNYNE